MTKKMWLGVLWGLSCGAQEKEPDFFNERTTVVGVEENVVLQTNSSLGSSSPKIFNEKREEKGILVEGEKPVFIPQPSVQPTPQYAQTAWGGEESFSNREAIGWSVPATFMNTSMHQRMAARSLPMPMGSPRYGWR